MVVQLVDQAGDVVAATVTDAQGAYQFADLVAGNYRLVEVQPNGWLDGRDIAGTIAGQPVGQAINPGDRIEQIVLGWGQQGLDYDFGELLPTQIFGSVHLSTVDGDCFGEEFVHAPLADVLVATVELRRRGHPRDPHRRTGAVRLSRPRAGRYGVRETTPADLLDGGAQAGHIDGRSVGQVYDSNTVLEIDLRSGDTVRDVEFCEHEPSTLSGLVYHDRNDNGRRDAGEEPIAGVTLLLYDDGGSEVGRTRTDEAGGYQFARLERGQYRVVEIQPDGWHDGLDSAGRVDGVLQGQAVNPGDEIRRIDLGWGQVGVEYNFGELRPSSLSGRVHADLNEDCELQDNEWTLSGVTIELLDAGGQVVAVQQTDAKGEFHFLDLRPGQYTLRELQPTGYFTAGQKAGSGGGADGVANLISQIAISSAEDLIDYRFCEEPPSVISGYVFQDGPTILLRRNEQLPADLTEIRDGLRTADDQLLGGVVVELRNGVFGTPIDGSTALPGYYPDGPIRTVTDDNGFYEFAGLHKGNYSLVRDPAARLYRQHRYRRDRAGHRDQSP